MRIVVALVEHDLPRAADELDARVRELLARVRRRPPLPYMGACGPGARRDRRADGSAKRTPRRHPGPANRGAFAWADAVTPAAPGGRDEAAALLADGEEALAACRGGGGCCTPSC
jgi:hypothetical protein